MPPIVMDGKATAISVGGVAIMLGITWTAATLWSDTRNEIRKNRENIGLVSSNVETQLEGLQAELGEIRNLLSEAAEDRFRNGDMRRWAVEFKKSNPTLVVPDPSDDYLTALPTLRAERPGP
jgi:hypothetical protein